MSPELFPRARATFRRRSAAFHVTLVAIALLKARLFSPCQIFRAMLFALLRVSMSVFRATCLHYADASKRFEPPFRTVYHRARHALFLRNTRHESASPDDFRYYRFTPLVLRGRLPFSFDVIAHMFEENIRCVVCGEKAAGGAVRVPGSAACKAPGWLYIDIVFIEVDIDIG